MSAQGRPQRELRRTPVAMAVISDGRNPVSAQGRPQRELPRTPVAMADIVGKVAVQ